MNYVVLIGFGVDDFGCLVLVLNPVILFVVSSHMVLLTSSSLLHGISLKGSSNRSASLR